MPSAGHIKRTTQQKSKTAAAIGRFPRPLSSFKNKIDLRERNRDRV